MYSDNHQRNQETMEWMNPVSFESIGSFKSIDCNAVNVIHEASNRTLDNPKITPSKILLKSLHFPLAAHPSQSG